MIGERKKMSLKSKFLSFVQMQMSAEDILRAHGNESKQTKLAFEQANQLKREVLNRIDELEHEINLKEEPNQKNLNRIINE